MVDKALFSSATEEWATPEEFFNQLNDIFKFEVDVCASHENAKCPLYYTKELDGLKQDWNGKICWMNPPYGDDMPKWMEKAYREGIRGGAVVCLIPARTDTKWWHDWVEGKAIYAFRKGRLKFGGAKNGAPFPSVIVVYGSNLTREQLYGYIQKKKI